MARIPVVLETFSWPTRSAAEAAFRGILRNSGYSVGDAVSDPVHDLASHADDRPWVPFDRGTDPVLECAQRLSEQGLPPSPSVAQDRRTAR